LFWREEEEPTLLSDAELDAILYHGHYGVDTRDFTPVTVTVNSDWALLTLDPTQRFIRDPAAIAAGEYKNCTVMDQALSVDTRMSSTFMSDRKIPIFVCNNCASYNLQIQHGSDAAHSGDCQGNVVVNYPDRQFRSGYVPGDPKNTTEFNIAPAVVTPGLVTIRGEWGEVSGISGVKSQILPDPTVDQKIYENVFTMERTGNYGFLMVNNESLVEKKSDVPFLLISDTDKQTTIELYREHEGQKSEVALMIGQHTYVESTDSIPTRYDIVINARPPPIPM